MIREWREKQMEMLRKKDEEEENSRNRMRDQAAQVTINVTHFQLSVANVILESTMSVNLAASHSLSLQKFFSLLII